MRRTRAPTLARPEPAAARLAGKAVSGASVASAERIPFQRAVAVVTESSIAIRPGWRQLAGPIAQAVVSGIAVWVVVAFMNSLPLWALMTLLGIALVLGPAAVLGFIYSVYGTEFLIERHKGTARWHQGFLGLGIGTFELVPFDRIERVIVESDAAEDLSSGQLQDLVQIDVRIAKDNGRVLDVASVTSPRAFLSDALARANRLAEAIGTMTGREYAKLELPVEELALAPVRPRRRRPRRSAGARSDAGPNRTEA